MISFRGSKGGHCESESQINKMESSIKNKKGGKNWKNWENVKIEKWEKVKMEQ